MGFSPIWIAYVGYLPKEHVATTTPLDSPRIIKEGPTNGVVYRLGGQDPGQAKARVGRGNLQTIVPKLCRAREIACQPPNVYH